MKLKKIISVLEDCHTKLHYFCDDAESTPWYAEARKQLRHTIKFMEHHLTQQSSGQETPVASKNKELFSVVDKKQKTCMYRR